MINKDISCSMSDKSHYVKRIGVISNAYTGGRSVHYPQGGLSHPMVIFCRTLSRVHYNFSKRDIWGILCLDTRRNTR